MQPVNDDDQSPDDAHLQEEEPDDGLIARAGDSDVSIDDLIQFLRLSLNWTVIEQLIERTLIEKAFEENEIELTDQELDAFVETYRADRGLLTARETERWLNENKLTADDLYDLCEFEAKQDRLKKLLFNEETIRARFVLSRGDYETVECYEIVIGKESKAKEIAALINDGKSFFELARQHSEEDATRKVCGYTGQIIRSSLRPELESRIYAASEGDVIGPIKSLGIYHLLLIEKFHQPDLTPAVQAHIREGLFRAWKQEQREMANVEMNV